MRRNSLAVVLLGVGLVPTPSGFAQGVRGFPYMAKTRTEVGRNGGPFRVIAEGAEYRDSAGRVRIEQSYVRKDGKKVEQVEIAVKEDPKQLTFYSLSPATLTGTRHRSSAPRQEDPASPDRWLVRHHKDLGTQVFEGQECKGLRYGPAPIASHYDVWRCEGDIVALRVYYRNDGWVEKEIRYDIRRVEPPAALFTVPGNYRVVEHTGANHQHKKTCPACGTRLSVKAGAASPRSASTSPQS
jgi:hypothetical protein